MGPARGPRALAHLVVVLAVQVCDANHECFMTSGLAYGPENNALQFLGDPNERFGWEMGNDDFIDWYREPSSPCDGMCGSACAADERCLQDAHDATCSCQPITCPAGYQCVPKVQEPFVRNVTGVCSRCIRGQYCPAATVNPAGASQVFDRLKPGARGELSRELTFNMCPPGYNCPSPTERYECAAGRYCPFATHDGGWECEDETLPPGVDASFLTWKFAGYCKPKNMDPFEDFVCGNPGGGNTGFFCPNASVEMLCPKGYYCVAGSMEPRKCSSAWFGSRHPRPVPRGPLLQPTADRLPGLYDYRASALRAPLRNLWLRERSHRKRAFRDPEAIRNAPTQWDRQLRKKSSITLRRRSRKRTSYITEEVEVSRNPSTGRLGLASTGRMSSSKSTSPAPPQANCS